MLSHFLYLIPLLFPQLIFRGFPLEPQLTRLRDCGYEFGVEGESHAAIVTMVTTVMTAKMAVVEVVEVVFLYLAVQPLFTARVGARIDSGTKRYHG